MRAFATFGPTMFAMTAFAIAITVATTAGAIMITSRLAVRIVSAAMTLAIHDWSWERCH